MTLPENYAFVDGSFNAETGVYGYGGFIVVGDKKFQFKGSGDNAEAAKSRNISGEIMGAMRAIKAAIKLGAKDITLFYDYMGIEQWATHSWEAKKPIAIRYVQFMDKAKEMIEINFKHVPAHTGIEGNEFADKLAKDAVGIA